MEVPVRRGGHAGDRQLAVRGSGGGRGGGWGASRQDDFPAFPLDEFDRHFDNMQRQLTNFKPFDMFPFSDGGPGSWFGRVHDEMRRVHNEMMQFMRDLDLQPSFDELWHFPSMADCFVKDENGQTRFRAKFDLQAFDPEDIEVRVDNQTLSVQAKHTHSSQTSSRQQYFCRAMLLPDGVRTDELKSKLDKNGVLTVEAPAPGVEIGRLDTSRATRLPIEGARRRRHSHDRRAARLRQRHRKEVKEDRDGARVHLTLPIDEIYGEKDIRIRCGGGRLVVEGEKNGNHFSRSFDIASNVDPQSLDARLDNGLLTVIGPTHY